MRTTSHAAQEDGDRHYRYHATTANATISAIQPPDSPPPSPRDPSPSEPPPPPPVSSLRHIWTPFFEIVADPQEMSQEP